MNTELREAEWRDRLLYFLGRRRAFVVDGDSMLPTLKSGDAILIETSISIKVGELVLARHPFRSSVKMVKRVADIDEDGSVFLSGDNPSESSDSRTFGAVSIKSIVGRVACRLK